MTRWLQESANTAINTSKVLPYLWEMLEAPVAGAGQMVASMPLCKLQDLLLFLFNCTALGTVLLLGESACAGFKALSSLVLPAHVCGVCLCNYRHGSNASIVHLG